MSDNRSAESWCRAIDPTSESLDEFDSRGEEMKKGAFFLRGAVVGLMACFLLLYLSGTFPEHIGVRLYESEAEQQRNVNVFLTVSAMVFGLSGLIFARKFSNAASCLFMALLIAAPCSHGEARQIELADNAQQRLIIDNLNLDGRTFFSAYMSQDVQQRRLAEMYLAGVLDAGEGRSWCDYASVLPSSVQERQYMEFKKLSDEALKKKSFGNHPRDSLQQTFMQGSEMKPHERNSQPERQPRRDFVLEDHQLRWRPHRFDRRLDDSASVQFGVLLLSEGHRVLALALSAGWSKRIGGIQFIETYH